MENSEQLVVEPVLQLDPPAWFRREVGFRFIWDFDECVYLGIGGYRSIESVSVSVGDVKLGVAYELKFNPKTHECFAYRFKDEWHLASVQQQLVIDPTWWGTLKPAPVR